MKTEFVCVNSNKCANKRRCLQLDGLLVGGRLSNASYSCAEHEWQLTAIKYNELDNSSRAGHGCTEAQREKVSVNHFQETRLSIAYSARHPTFLDNDERRMRESRRVNPFGQLIHF